MTHEYARASAGGPVVVKYGGNAMPSGNAPDPVLLEVAALRRDGWPIVLVHGGGPEIDRALAERAIPSERIDGLRVTSAAALEITEAVLCGTLNKRIVRTLGGLGVRAAGVSGEDAGTLVAERERGARGEDLGFVGRVSACDPRLIEALLAADILPVVAPLAIASNASHAYNVNADLSAAAIAGALRARAFVLVTNVSRVRRDPDDETTGVDRFSLAEAQAFARSDACRSSMKPKIAAAAQAVAGGSGAAYICASGDRTIRGALLGDATVIAA